MPKASQPHGEDGTRSQFNVKELQQDTNFATDNYVMYVHVRYVPIALTWLL